MIGRGTLRSWGDISFASESVVRIFLVPFDAAMQISSEDESGLYRVGPKNNGHRIYARYNGTMDP